MDINHVFISGRLGSDVELRYAQSGLAIARFSIAHKPYRKESQGEYLEDKTQWIDGVMFGKTAENSAPYMKKGMEVVIQGALQVNSFEKRGEKKTTYEIRANSIKVVSRLDQLESKNKEETPVPHPYSVFEDEVNSLPF